MPFLWKVKWTENIEHDFIKSPCTRTKKKDQKYSKTIILRNITIQNKFHLNIKM